jgi:hypothetical protein
VEALLLIDGLKNMFEIGSRWIISLRWMNQSSEK